MKVIVKAALVLGLLNAAPALAASLRAPAPKSTSAPRAIEDDIQPTVQVAGRALVVETLAEAMARRHTPAISIVVADHGRILWAKAFGYADVEAHKRASTRTLFQAASISKPVAASAAMQLVQEGALNLDAPVNSTLKSWRLPDSPLTKDAPVTLRGLLTHTAGLTVHGFAGYPAGVPTPTLVQVLDGVPPANSSPVVVERRPGTLWSYSGGGLTIAQLMMQDVTGESFPTLMRKRVLGPVGMGDSTYEQPLPATLAPRAAHAYLSDGAAVKGDWHTYPEMAAAGLWTTPTDLAKWAMALQDAYDGRSATLMSRGSARAMLTPGLGDWGLGIEVKGDGDARRFAHSGGNWGFRSYLVGWFTGGRVIAVMDNGDDGWPLAFAVTQAVARHYGWRGFEGKTVEAAAVPPAELAKIAGSYGDGEARLALSGNALVSIGSGAPEELIPLSADAFIRASDGVAVTVERDAGGRVVGLHAAGRFLRRGG